MEIRGKGYRYWDPTVHKVVSSKDVIFAEDKKTNCKKREMIAQ